MEIYQDGKRVETINRLTLDDVRRNLVRFRHDSFLYTFWRNVYLLRKEAAGE